ncbi:MAG: hypothetical protein JSU86_12225, partial [Phycisphaerales bacterium]
VGSQAEGLLCNSRGQAQRRPRMVPPPNRPTLKGSSILCFVYDGTYMRPLQGRMERVLELPWATSRRAGTCPRLL